MNERDIDNDTFTLITAFRKLCNADQLRLHQAMCCADFHARLALIDGMTKEGKQIIALAFERMTCFKQRPVPKEVQPAIYVN